MTLGLILLALLNPPPIVVEYLLPRPGAFPHDPAVGRDGIVWYTDQANSYIGRLDPASGKVTDYPTPTPASGPHGIDRKSTRLNSSHTVISYAVFCLKKKNKKTQNDKLQNKM